MPIEQAWAGLEAHLLDEVFVRLVLDDLIELGAVIPHDAHLIVRQRRARLVAQEVQIPRHRAARDAKLGHEVRASGRFPAARTLPDHLDHAPDSVILGP
jgi:hypothetical protein